MIRKANKEDVKVIDGLCEFIISLDIDIVKSVGEEGLKKIVSYCFSSEEDRFSYKNCAVFVVDDQIEGFSFSYHYDKLREMKSFWFDDVVKHFSLQDDEIIFDYDEMFEGEFYLDTLYVFSGNRGKGIGKNLLTAFCNEPFDVKSLNVAKSNDGARKLYESYGFRKNGEIFIGHEYYDHLVLITK